MAKANTGGRATIARQRLARRHAVEPERVKRFELRMARLADVRRREQSGKRWCILRTASRSTVALLDDLEGAGFDVWTPTEVIKARAGRARESIERCIPMMPSFIFAAENDAANLLRLSADPTRRNVDFTVFHYRERVPLIADRDLGTLRDMEEVARARREQQLEQDRRQAAAASEKARRAALRNGARPIPVGSEVQMPSGAFSGMAGIVIESSRGVTTVSLGGLHPVKIDTFLLAADILEAA